MCVPMSGRPINCGRCFVIIACNQQYIMDEASVVIKQKHDTSTVH